VRVVSICMGWVTLVGCEVVGRIGVMAGLDLRC
jgi:hypothetical protein